MKRLLRFLSGRPDRSAAPLPPPTPARRTYVVGDIHGMDAPLSRLLARIAKDRKNQPADLVFAGDYIDRGGQSAAVLNRLFRLEQSRSDTVTCLMGNHERMMLDFLDDPARKGALWLVNGGQETLESFGITRRARAGISNPLDSLSQALRAALPSGMEDWLRGLPLMWQSGNLAVVHAAADPFRPMQDQHPKTLIWGHPDFPDTPRSDGLWMAHGHVITEKPIARNGHIAVDTGACRNGPLTAACIEAGKVRFLQE